MLRRVITLAAAAVILASATADVGACGDKFLRAGRSPRLRRYAALHQASILIVYAPARSKRSGVEEFEGWLKRAGHRPVAVETSAADQAFASGTYDVVIVDYADAAELEGRIDRSVMKGRAKPSLLPVLYKPTKTAEAAAAKAYQCLLRPDRMDKYRALEEIDRLMTLRLEASTTP